MHVYMYLHFWCALPVAEKNMYPLIARFVAAKPSMDLSDIPLYYSMMHSSSAQVWDSQHSEITLITDGLANLLQPFQSVTSFQH